MKNVIYTENAPQAIGPYSQAVMVNGTLYCSGQIPINPKTGNIVEGEIAQQTKQICENIGNVLKEAGLTFDNVVKTTCYLSNMEDFAEFNKVYGEYFVSKPARSCVAVKALPKNALAEVEVIAVKF